MTTPGVPGVPEVKQEEGPAPVVVRAGMFGQIEPHVLGENIEEYLNRLEMFFLVNDTPEEKKVPVLITVAGPSLYTVLVKLCAPEDPRTKTYADLVAELKEHLAPTTNVVAERYKFRKCEQLASQSITDFIINLKAMAQSCKYDNFLSDALRDQFVAGINDQSLRKKLLTEADLTFEKACSIGRSWEAALSQNKEMSSQSSSPKIASFQKEGARKPKPRSHHPEKEQNKSSSRPSQKSVKPCYRCGRHHDPATCPARDWTCYTCGKQGHVSTSCQSKNRPSKKPGRSNRVAEMSDAVEVLRLGLLAEVNESSEVNESVSVSEHPVSSVPESSSLSILEPKVSKLPSSSNGGPKSLNRINSPEFVPLTCEGHRLEFEADCGACRSIISFDTYQKLFSHCPLLPTSQEFISVSGQRIQP